MNREELESLDREGLVVRAEASGIRRARILTRPELIDELLRRQPGLDPTDLKRSRGFFGRARDLLSRVVERGLHLPDAVDRIRWSGSLPPSVPHVEPEAVPTLTLAEIYAAQGHKARAIETLHRVLEREPDHVPATALLARLQDAAYVPPAPPLPPEPDEPPPAQEASEPDVDVPASESDAGRDSVAEAPSSEETLLEASSEAPSTPEASAPEVSAASSPELEDVDGADCWALPLSPGAMYVGWRVAPALRDEGDARFVLRVVAVSPSWDGPSTDMRDLDVAIDDRELVVRGLPPEAIVRVAIGFVREDGFSPLAHSPMFEPLGPGADAELVRWTLEGAMPPDPTSPVARARARAETLRAHEGVAFATLV